MFLFFLVKYLKLTIEKGQRKSTVRALSSLRTPRPLKALVTEVVKIKQGICSNWISDNLFCWTIMLFLIVGQLNFTQHTNIISNTLCGMFPEIYIKWNKWSTTQLMFTFAYREKAKYMNICLHYKTNTTLLHVNSGWERVTQHVWLKHQSL